MNAFTSIVKREFLGVFYSPIAYVVGAAFLAINGFALWALMQTLSDPTAPSEVGAVLQQFFGGTLLHWLVIFVLLATISMGSVAEDKKRGTWEMLMTTQVSPASIIGAKWLALVLFYILLWVPSLFLIVIFQTYLPDGESLDIGPIASAYLGVFSVGACLLSIGVALSCVTRNQVIAAVLSFSFYLVLLMAGEMTDLAGTMLPPKFGLWSLGLRPGLALFVRGEMSLAFFINLLGLTLVFLCLAVIFVAPDSGARRRSWLVLFFLSIASGSLSYLINEHVPTFDVSGGHINSLEETTEAILGEVDVPIEIIAVRPGEQGFDSVYSQVMQLLYRMQAKQPFLQIREIDPLAQPHKISQWAYELAIEAKDLQSVGAVIFRRGDRRELVDLLSMASFNADDLGVGVLSEFVAESMFRRVLASLLNKEERILCVSKGHGEFSSGLVSSGTPVSAALSEESMSSPHWREVAQRLERDGTVLRDIVSFDANTLSDCDGVMIFGASSLFAPEDLDGLRIFMKKGGNLLVALRSRPEEDKTALPLTGLRLLLSGRGLVSKDAVLVDPDREVALAPAWMTYAGYGNHVIVDGFKNRRTMVWDAPRALASTEPNTVILVQASEGAWGETQLESFFKDGVYQKGSSDLASSWAAALAQEDSRGSRVVLIGSAESLSSIWSERGVSANDRFLQASVLWVLGHRHVATLEDKRPENIRLIMSVRDLRRAFVSCVIVSPLLLAIFGALLWWWRRRES